MCRLGARKVGNLIHRKGRGCALKPEPIETVKGGCVLTHTTFSSLPSMNRMGHLPCILPLICRLLTHHCTCEGGGGMFLQNGIH